MTHTINEHLTNLLIAEEDIFMVVGISNNRVDNLQSIGRWFTRNPETHFKYIRGRLTDKKSKLNLKLLKTLYPNIRFVTTIDNPWCRLYQIYNNYPATKKKFLSLTNFVKLVQLIPHLCANILDNYPLDNSIIILRNEHIKYDFAKFSKSSTAEFLETENVDYRNFFDSESNDIICSIFRKDIEFFYPDLSS